VVGVEDRGVRFSRQRNLMVTRVTNENIGGVFRRGGGKREVKRTSLLRAFRNHKERMEHRGAIRRISTSEEGKPAGATWRQNSE